jgi:hypothetical protein
MGAAVLDRAKPASAAPHAGGGAGGGSATLEGVIVRAWEGLAAHRGVSCPLCGGHMAPRHGASDAAPVGGRCHDCGTVLG